MRYFKAVKLQHTKLKNWHTDKTQYGKRRTENIEAGPSLNNFEQLPMIHIHPYLLYHVHPFPSTLGYNIAMVIVSVMSPLPFAHNDRLSLEENVKDPLSLRSVRKKIMEPL